MTNAVLYTDGSASIRPDGTFLCGYAYLFVVDGKPLIGRAFPGLGTINQAEMCAVYAGMNEALERGIEVTAVYTDSTYVVNGLEANYEKYDTGEWTNSQGSEVSNKELWIRLIEFTRKHNLKIPAAHVKGHTGQPFNELCDKLAKEAAMSQQPVTEYSDIDMCRQLGFYIPGTIEPVPAVAVRTEDPIHISGDLVDTLATYTDDRAKCCYITYPGMVGVLASKGVSVWSAQKEDSSLSMAYTVRPVVSDSGVELPLYRYMTESGTPFDVVTSNSTVQWQGDDFNRALSEAIAEIDDDSDLIIASYNLASAKKYQGIYFLGYSRSKGTGRILNAYRTERIPHGKHMCISHGYLQALHYRLTYDTSAVCSGLVVSTTNFCLIVTSDEGGMIVGSSVLPHTITIQDCFTVIVDKPDKPNVRVTDAGTLSATAVYKASHRVQPAANLTEAIPEQDYTPTKAVMDAMSRSTDGEFKPYAESSNDIIYGEDAVADTVCQFKSYQTTGVVDVSTKDKLVQEYLELGAKMSEIIKAQQAILQKILDLDSYPQMTPDKVEEIVQRTREEMINKFNNMFK